MVLRHWLLTLEATKVPYGKLLGPIQNTAAFWQHAHMIGKLSCGEKIDLVFGVKCTKSLIMIPQLIQCAGLPKSLAWCWPPGLRMEQYQLRHLALKTSGSLQKFL